MVLFENIPEDLRDYPNWILWKVIKKGDKHTKVPFSISGRPAESNNPATWSDFKTIKKTYEDDKDNYDGVGFVFSESDPFTGIDLDDIKDGSIKLRKGSNLGISYIFEKLASYTEESPSGNGYHVIIRAKKPEKKPRSKKGGFECYDKKRYFTFTGKHVPQTPLTVEERQVEFDQLYQEVFAPKQEPQVEETVIPQREGNCDLNLIRDFILTQDISAEKKNRSIWLYAVTAVLKWNGTTKEEGFSFINSIPSLKSKVDDKNNPFDWWVKYEWDETDPQEKPIKLMVHACKEEGVSLPQEIRRQLDDMPSPQDALIAFEELKSIISEDSSFALEDRYLKAAVVIEKNYPAVYQRLINLLKKEKVSLRLFYRSVKQMKEDTSSKSTLGGAAMNDEGNAKRFVDLYGDVMRFDPATNLFLLWNKKFWELDRKNKILQMSTKVSGEILKESSSPEFLKFAEDSGNLPHLNAAVKITSTMEGIPITSQELDSDPYLICCQNGTFDTSKGEFREHRKEDMITKITGTAYDPDAKSDIWEWYLETFVPDPGFRKWLQYKLGKAVLGIQSSEMLFLLSEYKGSTGKTTLMEAIKSTLGDYSATASSKVFLRKENPNSPQSEVVKLRGARFVGVTEFEEDRTLDTAFIKFATGNDIVSARSVYGKWPIEFMPQWTIVLGVNTKPKIIQGGDDALWRRILIVPFEHSVDGEPKEVRDKKYDLITKPNPALLLWLIEGACMEEEPLMPLEVKEMTMEYRKDEDPLLTFVEDHCKRKGDITFREFYMLFSNWIESHFGEDVRKTSVNKVSKDLKNKINVSISRKFINGKNERLISGLSIDTRNLDELSQNEEKEV